MSSLLIYLKLAAHVVASFTNYETEQFPKAHNESAANKNAQKYCEFTWLYWLLRRARPLSTCGLPGTVHWD
jgi:hypothetical protein